jgi:hypothetical protein
MLFYPEQVCFLDILLNIPTVNADALSSNIGVMAYMVGTRNNPKVIKVLVQASSIVVERSSFLRFPLIDDAKMGSIFVNSKFLNRNFS